MKEKRNLGLKNIVEGVEIKPFKWRRVNKENASKLWKIIQEAGDYLLLLIKLKRFKYLRW
jgi:hypothetical protein